MATPETVSCNSISFFLKEMNDKKNKILLNSNNKTFQNGDKKIKSQSSDFLNSIIHELKTPLNAIIGFSEILKHEMRNPKAVEECVDYANEIERTASNLNDIVNDLLDVNSNSSQNFSIDLSKEIKISEVISRAVKLNYDFALRRKVKLTTEIDENIANNIVPVKLDEKRMKQILTNLISNSVKYSPEKTEVKISAKIINQDVQNSSKILQIIVADQGFGMNEDEIATAFEKYKTIPNPNSGIVDSFGLGLPIVKELTELQGGSITVESKPNLGTKMILNFPL